VYIFAFYLLFDYFILFYFYFYFLMCESDVLKLAAGRHPRAIAQYIAAALGALGFPTDKAAAIMLVGFGV